MGSAASLALNSAYSATVTLVLGSAMAFEPAWSEASPPSEPLLNASVVYFISHPQQKFNLIMIEVKDLIRVVTNFSEKSSSLDILFEIL